MSPRVLGSLLFLSTTAVVAPAFAQSTQTAATMPAVLTASADPAAVSLTAGKTGQALYDQATKSLVAVQFHINGETQQFDWTFAGIVVSSDGLVLIPLAAVSEQLPDVQMQNFKIIVPHTDADPEELDAEFQGRDDRAGVAFVKFKPSATDKTPHVWTPIKFENVTAKVGEPVYSVAMLPKADGYRSFFSASMVSAQLRVAVKQTLTCNGSLAAPSAPVFNAAGQAIGIVSYQPPAALLLDDRNPQQELLSSLATNRLFTPVSEFMIGLTDPPTAGHPEKLAYTGVAEMNGLKKDDAAFYGLENQPAISISDILPDSPADKAGLKKKDVIVKVDGKPLERGDEAEALPLILQHQLRMYDPGTVVTFTVINEKDKKPRDVKVTMEPLPKRANVAERFWNEDLGFGVREMVLLDRYAHKMKKDQKNGVLVTVLKEGGAAGGQAGLQPNDIVTRVNGQTVTDLPAFKTAFETFRKAHEHEAVVMVVRRGNSDETVRIEPPQ